MRASRSGVSGVDWNRLQAACKTSSALAAPTGRAAVACNITLLLPLVLRTIVDQEQEPGGRRSLDQAVEQGLGLVDPVQILEDQEQRLFLTLAQ